MVKFERLILGQPSARGNTRGSSRDFRRQQRFHGTLAEKLVPDLLQVVASSVSTPVADQHGGPCRNVERTASPFQPQVCAPANFRPSDSSALNTIVEVTSQHKQPALTRWSDQKAAGADGFSRRSCPSLVVS